jgi:DNA-directed RNA polymerase specialized sigma24 family protein
MNEQPLTPDARTLAADLFEQFAEPLLSRLARAFPGTDPQRVADAVVTAILFLSRNFQRYQRRRASLTTLLLVIARRKLLKLLRADTRRAAREQEKARGSVTTEASAGQSLLDRLGDRELAERVRGEVAHTDEERRVLELWRAGETDSAALAAALHLTGPAEEQRAHVERILARLRQRLHRCGLRYRQQEAEE